MRLAQLAPELAAGDLDVRLLTRDERADRRAADGVGACAACIIATLADVPDAVLLDLIRDAIAGSS